MWIFLLIAGTFMLVSQQLTAAYERGRIQAIAERENNHLDTLNRAVQQEFFEIIEDMATLTEVPVLTRYLDDFDEELCRALERYLETVARNYRRYDQIRLLDLEGRERVRINHERGMVYSVMKRELQDKSQRYYFKAALALRAGEAYVSRLDLNVENGVLEVPYKPMVRFVMPVADSRGQIKGYVVFNYRGNILIDTVRSQGGNEMWRQVYFVNRDGYYFSHPNADREWGFMLGREEDNLAREFPQIWQALESQTQGRQTNADGLFLFKVINPLGSEYAKDVLEKNVSQQRIARQTNDELRWAVLLHIPTEQLYAQSFMHQPIGRVINIVVYFLFVLLSWLFAYESLKRKQEKIQEREHTEELVAQANTDYLTGLYNRRYFYEQAKRELSRSVRHRIPLSVMMFDIDHFKSINDLHGHDLGDAVLKALGDTCRRLLRESDICARIGGEEFAVLLTQTDDAQTLKIAERLREALAETSVPLDDGTKLKFTVSLGIGSYEPEDKDIDDLLKRADKGLYEAKRAGRNRVWGVG